MADSHSFSTYVQYWSPAQVIDAKFQGLPALPVLSNAEGSGVERETRPGGHVFVYGDVIDPLPALLRRGPESVDQLRRLGEKLEPGLMPVHTNRFGTIYEWSCNE
jgi:hypothetical protein